MKLSIIIPIYNVEPYLETCLDSVISQSYKDAEILLIDDGSTDNGYKICQHYQKRDSRIKVYHQENQGLSAARNAGLEMASGDYIWFIDSDDWMEKNSMEAIVSHLDDCDLLIFNFNWMKNGKIIKSSYIQNDFYDVGSEEKFLFYIRDFLFPKPGSFNHHYFCVWNKIYRRKLIVDNELRFINEREIAGEDEEFNLKYLSVCSKIKSIKDVLYFYRIRENSITGIWEKEQKNLVFECNTLALYLYNFYQRSDRSLLVKNFHLLYTWIMNVPLNQMGINGKTNWKGYIKKLNYQEFAYACFRNSFFHPRSYMKYSYFPLWIKTMIMWGINYPVLNQCIVMIYNLKDKVRKNRNKK